MASAEDFLQIQEQLNELRKRNEELQAELSRRNTDAPPAPPQQRNDVPKFPVKRIMRGRVENVPVTVRSPQSQGGRENFTRSPQGRRDNVEVRDAKKRKVVEEPVRDGGQWVDVEEDNIDMSMGPPIEEDIQSSKQQPTHRFSLQRVKSEQHYWGDEEEPFGYPEDAATSPNHPIRRNVFSSPGKMPLTSNGWWERVAKLRHPSDIDEFIRMSGGPRGEEDFRSYANRVRFAPQAMSMGIEVAFRLNRCYRRQIGEMRDDMRSLMRRVMDMERRLASKATPDSKSLAFDIAEFSYLHMSMTGLDREDFWIESSDLLFRRVNFFDLYAAMEGRRPTSAVTADALVRRFSQEIRFMCHELIKMTCTDLPFNRLRTLNIKKISNLNLNAEGLSDFPELHCTREGVPPADETSHEDGQEEVDPVKETSGSAKRTDRPPNNFLWLNQKLHASFLKFVIGCICSNTDLDISPHMYVRFIEKTFYDVCSKIRHQNKLSTYRPVPVAPADITLNQ